MLPHYSSLVSDPNFEIPFIITVLQYIPKYHQDPLPRHLIYSVSHSLYTIKIVTEINNTKCKHLFK